VRTSTSTVATLRDALAARRAVRRERQQLERELASYSTPAERLELEAMIDRHSPEETREVRDILARQAVERAGAASLGLRPTG
jgi:hypothetical protein